ncbi:hypothetical protein EVD32_06180 [Bacteroidales bacterium SW299]|nr:hypothetical protein [Bacteroidales bacterium SW299]
MNHLIKHYFPSLVLSGLFFSASCTDDNEMMRISNSIRFTSDVRNAWLPVGTRSMAEDTHPSVSSLETDGMNLLYLHTLYADSIEPQFADNASPSTRAAPASAGDMYETFGVSAYSYTGDWNGTELPNYMYDVSVDSPHTKTLRELRTVLGTKEAPYNLANGKGGSAVENTANCYVIGAPGYYSFPLVYGNAIKDGAANSSAYTSAAASSSSILNPFVNHAGAGIKAPYLTDNGCTPAYAELVWQDASSLVSEIRYNTGSNGGNISFKVDKHTIQQGNAVIAVKDASGTVLWSWHIWVTDEDVDNAIEVTNHQNVRYRFMPVPLGWCDGETVTYGARGCKVRFTAGEQTADIAVSQNSSTVTTGGNHPYYQWGRKDPFRPSNGGNGNKTWYDANGTASAAHMKVEAFPYGTECIRNYILKPDVMQKNPSGDNTCRNLWNADNNTYSANDNQVVKTVYDPCPVGFKLPANNAFTGFTTTGGNTSNTSPANGTWDSARKGWNFYARANRTGQQIFFPASGSRNYSDGSLSLVGSYGLYWLAGPNNERSGWRLNFFSSYVNPLGNYYRSAGYGVFPAQE